MESENIVIDSVEEATDDKGKQYVKVTDKAGVTRNIKEGRGKLLTNKRQMLQEGKAVKLHFQDYKTPDGRVFPFVSDFEAIEGLFETQAIKKVQIQQHDNKDRSMALSYAKDLACADVIQVSDILSYATKFIAFIGGQDAKTDTKVSQDETGDTRVNDTGGDGLTAGKVIQLVADKMKWKDPEPVNSWLQNVCKVTLFELEQDPTAAWQKIKNKMNW